MAENPEVIVTETAAKMNGSPGKGERSETPVLIDLMTPQKLAEAKIAQEKVDQLREKLESAQQSEEEVKQHDNECSEHARMAIREQFRAMNDSARIDFFESCFDENSHLINGKTIMVVGAGIGLIPMKLARLKPARVIAVETNVALAKVCREVIELNHLQEIITVVQCPVESLTKLPGVKSQDQEGGTEKAVDVLISDWMGPCLFGKHMFDSVLQARDKFLKKGGAMIPDVLNLHIVAMSDKQGWKHKMKTQFKHTEFDVSPLLEVLCKQPSFYNVPVEQVCSKEAIVKKIDMATAVSSDQILDDVTVGLQMKASKLRHDYLTHIGFFWNAFFMAGCKPCGFTTNPEAPTTNYRNTVFTLPKYFPINNNGKAEVTISMSPGKRVGAQFTVRLRVNVTGIADLAKQDSQVEQLYTFF